MHGDPTSRTCATATTSSEEGQGNRLAHLEVCASAWPRPEHDRRGSRGRLGRTPGGTGPHSPRPRRSALPSSRWVSCPKVENVVYAPRNPTAIAVLVTPVCSLSSAVRRGCQHRRCESSPYADRLTHGRGVALPLAQVGQEVGHRSVVPDVPPLLRSPGACVDRLDPRRIRLRGRRERASSSAASKMSATVARPGDR